MERFYIEKVEAKNNSQIGFNSEKENKNSNYTLCYILADDFDVFDKNTIEILINFKKCLDIYNKINNTK